MKEIKKITLRGRLCRYVISKGLNLNPLITPDPVEKIRKAGESFLNDDVPSGYTLSKELTPNGTKYERVSKIGSQKNGKVILYFHGGAYLSGLLSFYRNFITDFYPAANGCELILLDYKLAPEYTYPTQLNEALDLWYHLTETLGYEAENIIVAGDSAGANLTAAMLLKLRDEGKMMPKAGICISLWGDMTASGESFLNNFNKDIMFGVKKQKFDPKQQDLLLNGEIFSFVGDADRTSPYVSPVFGDYKDFVPMLFTVGSHEMLLSDTLTVVGKFKKENIRTELIIQDGMFHIYPIYGKNIPEGKYAFERIKDFISEYLG